jgi:hypothetical protein
MNTSHIRSGVLLIAAHETDHAFSSQAGRGDGDCGHRAYLAPIQIAPGPPA